MNLRAVTTAMAAAVAMGMATVASAQEVVVGGKNFTEQQLLASITSQLLDAKGYEVDERAGMGSAAVRQAMENGQIDIYWEYTGTSLITYNKVTDKLDAQATYDKVKELDGKVGIVWLEPSAANNTYGLAMREQEATEMGIKSLSDLAKRANDQGDLTLASNAEFYARPDGLKPLEEAYGFEFGRENVKRMDSGLVYEALRNGDVNVGLVFATDGRIPAFDFVVLTDDKGYFPSYALAPVIRKEILDAQPELADVLNDVSAKLDDATVAALNAKVDVDKMSIEDAAADFLKTSGLI
jgi:osmoprotectant transport system substrate-binding protein